jgi:hypothetical protein
LAYPGKERTPDEQPLRQRDLAVLRTLFPRVDVRGYQFLSMIRRVLGPGGPIPLLDRGDDWLLARLPFLQRFCRYMVLTVQR